jgi:ElaA protein
MPGDIRWEIKPFMELSVTELHDLFRLRQEAFVVEQTCAFAEIDGIDPRCVHVLGFAIASNELLACARLVPAGLRFDEPSIGRVVTKQSVRGKGLGGQLMREAVKAMRTLYGPVTLSLSAQLRLQKFYADLGFAPVGELYEEDGIPHVVMRAFI